MPGWTPFDLVRAVRSLGGLTPTQKAVLMTLATYANGEGIAWPSVATLAADTGYRERATQGALRDLCAMGRLVVVSQAAGRTRRYLVVASHLPLQQMHPRTRCTPAADAPPHEVHPHPRSRCTPPPQQMRGTPAADAPEESIEETTEETTQKSPKIPPTPPGGTDSNQDESEQLPLVANTSEDSATGERSSATDATNTPVAEPPSPKRRQKKADPIQPVADAWEEQRLQKLEAGKRRKMTKPIPAADALWGDLRKCLQGNQRQGVAPLSVEDAVLIVRWAFCSDDNHARNALRREDGSGPLHQYLDPVTLFRISKVADKLRKARAWEEDQREGRATHKATQKKGRGYGDVRLADWIAEQRQEEQPPPLQIVEVSSGY